MSAPSAGSSGSPSGSPVPGYYPDPSIPGYIRYWNGSAWVPGSSRPAPLPGEDVAGSSGDATPPARGPGPVAAGPAAPGPRGVRTPAIDESGPMFLDEDLGAPTSQHGTDQYGTGRSAAGDPGPLPGARRSAETTPYAPLPGAPAGATPWGTPRQGVAASPPGATPGPAAGAPWGAVPAAGDGGPAGTGGRRTSASTDGGAAPWARTGLDGESTPHGGPQPFGPAGAGAGPAQPPRHASGGSAPGGPGAAAAGTGTGAGGRAVPGPRGATNATGGTPAGGGALPWAQQVQELARQDGAGAPVPGQSGGSGPGQGRPGGGHVPWRPPVNDPFLLAAQEQARPAGLGRRLVARVFDSLVVGAVTAAAAVPLGAAAYRHVTDKVDAARLSGEQVTVWLIDGTTGVQLGIVLAVMLVAGLLYEVLPTVKWGRTLGKKLTGLQVLDIESQLPPGFGAAVRRWLTHTLLDAVVIGFVGLAWCLFDRPWRQCWHDKAARTFVAKP